VRNKSPPFPLFLPLCFPRTVPPPDSFLLFRAFIKREPAPCARSLQSREWDFSLLLFFPSFLLNDPFPEQGSFRSSNAFFFFPSLRFWGVKPLPSLFPSMSQGFFPYSVPLFFCAFFPSRLRGVSLVPPPSPLFLTKSLFPLSTPSRVLILGLALWLASPQIFFPLMESVWR